MGKPGLLMCFLLATGCMHIEEAEQPAPPPESILLYYESLLAADQAQLETELRVLEELSETTPTGQIKIAVLLGLLQEPDRLDQALVLLRDMDTWPAPANADEIATRAFGRVWNDYLHTLKSNQLVHAESAANMSALQELRASYFQLTEEVSNQQTLVTVMSRNTRQLERQNQLLIEQLQALTAIEQQLIDIDAGVPQGDNDGKE